MRRVASRPSSSGMRMSISTTVGCSGRLIDRLEPVAGFTDDVDVVLTGQQHAETRRAPSTGRRRRALEWSSNVTVDGQVGGEHEATTGRHTRGHVAAVDLDTLAHTDQAATEPIGA